MCYQGNWCYVVTFCRLLCRVEIFVQNESWGCTKLGRDKLKSTVLDGDGSQEYSLDTLVLVIPPTNH